jgi:hypothetical protein
MKKISLLLVYVLAGTAFPAYAATGSAHDGFWLVLFCVALLLLIAGIWSMIDFLRHPPQAVFAFTKRLFKRIRSWFAFSIHQHHQVSAH